MTLEAGTLAAGDGEGMTHERGACWVNAPPRSTETPTRVGQGYPCLCGGVVTLAAIRAVVREELRGVGLVPRETVMSVFPAREPE